MLYDIISSKYGIEKQAKSKKVIIYLEDGCFLLNKGVSFYFYILYIIISIPNVKSCWPVVYKNNGRKLRVRAKEQPFRAEKCDFH